MVVLARCKEQPVGLCNGRAKARHWRWDAAGTFDSSLKAERRSFWRQGMQAGIKAAYDCVKQFSETDLTQDLKAIDVSLLVVLGDDDQIVPIAASALRTVELAPNAKLLVYPGGSHGLAQINADRFNADLLAFIRA